jgi:GTP-binding protein
LKITKVEYIGSYHKESLCPNDGKPEFAFIGRSNVGKSSLINLIMDRKDLARVSKQPGKTQSLNYFAVNDAWYLVDLPGYGYAKTSHTMRENWLKMIHYYLKNRKSLSIAFVLLDSRHTFQKIDHEFINWCGENQVPLAFIYTKCDKVKALERNANIKTMKKALNNEWEQIPDHLVSSAEERVGREDILLYIQNIITQISKTK